MFSIYILSSYTNSVNDGPCQSDSAAGPTFVTEPLPHQLNMIEIGTTITLFWKIQYESCNCSRGDSCFDEDLHFTYNDSGIFYPLEDNVIAAKLLFDADITRQPAGPNTTFSYANVRIIMFIDEYVRNNIASLTCTAILLNQNGCFTNSNTVHIAVANPTTTTTVTNPTTTTSNQSIPESSSSCMRACSLALTVCSSVKLLCFFQLMYVIATYYN